MMMRKIIGLLAAAVLVLAGCDAATPTPAPAPSNSTASPAVAGTPDPVGAPEHIEKAKAAIAANQFDVAINEAEAAVRQQATNDNAQYWLGKAYSEASLVSADPAKRQLFLNKAIEAYSAAIQQNPKRDDALTNLGTVYYQLGDWVNAQKYVEQALAVSANDAKSHYILGTIYLQQDVTKQPDMLQKAQQQFEAAIANDANLGAAYVGLANIYLFKQDFANATAQAQKGIALMKDAPDPYAFWALAQAQCSGTDKASGMQTLQQINALNPPDPLFMQQVAALEAKCK